MQNNEQNLKFLIKFTKQAIVTGPSWKHLNHDNYLPVSSLQATVRGPAVQHLYIFLGGTLSCSLSQLQETLLKLILLYITKATKPFYYHYALQGSKHNKLLQNWFYTH